MKRLLWNVKPFYALAAGCVAAWGVMAVFLPAIPTAPALAYTVMLALANIIAGAVAGLMLRHPLEDRPTWRREIGLSVALLLSASGGLLAMWAVAGQWRLIRGGLPYTALVWLLTPTLYILARGFASVWCWWEAKCRQRILFAITHTHLMTAVIIGALVFLVGAAWICYGVWQDQEMWSRLANPGYSLFSAVLLWLLVLILTAAGTFVAGVIILLPPSFLLSYTLGRRITRRIEALDRGAAALEAGDFSAQMPVEGTDEVARLQETFNSMAAGIRSYAASLEDEKAKVTELLDAQRRLTTDVSHELRTPVATISSYLESILAHWDEREPAVLHGDLETIAREAGHLRRLLDDLFALNTARVRHLSFEFSAVDPVEVTSHVVEALAPAVWHAARIEVMAEIPGPLPPVRADAQRLGQILKNLVLNGARHTPPGGYVVVALTAEDAYICFEVSDPGEGIAAGELSRIWEPFYKVDPTSGGAGLGLALVREFTEIMGGSVAVESEPGRGSSFFVRIPYWVENAGPDTTPPLPHQD